MSWADAIAAIKARLDASWSATPRKLQGDAFQLPQPPAAFVALEVTWNGSEQMTIGAPGANRVRRMGIIWIHAFVPVSVAGHDEAAAGHAAAAAALFENQDFAGVSCHEAEPGGSGDAEPEKRPGLYWRESVSIDFDFDETA